jgi:hypothetical protein
MSTLPAVAGVVIKAIRSAPTRIIRERPWCVFNGMLAEYLFGAPHQYVSCLNDHS